MGTYNFVPPSDAFGHGAKDVLPYIIWGNSPDDPSTKTERVNSLADESKRRVLEYFE